MERKRCVSCKVILIAQNGMYLHPETPCPGMPDCIEITWRISDEFLNKKFVEQYGKPKLNDYDLLKVYEDKIEKDKETSNSDLLKYHNFYEKKLSNPIIKFILKLSKKSSEKRKI